MLLIVEFSLCYLASNDTRLLCLLDHGEHVRNEYRTGKVPFLEPLHSFLLIDTETSTLHDPFYLFLVLEVLAFYKLECV